MATGIVSTLATSLSMSNLAFLADDGINYLVSALMDLTFGLGFNIGTATIYKWAVDASSNNLDGAVNCSTQDNHSISNKRDVYWRTK